MRNKVMAEGQPRLRRQGALSWRNEFFNHESDERTRKRFLGIRMCFSIPKTRGALLVESEKRHNKCSTFLAAEHQSLSCFSSLSWLNVFPMYSPICFLRAKKPGS